MEGLIKIGDVANRYGVSTRTIRYYEEIGLLECQHVTEKLERKPEIVKKLPHFYNIFCVSNPMEAYELYNKAFGVEKVSEDCPGGMAHIGIEVNGFYKMLREEHHLEPYAGQACCARFDSKEDLQKAYDILNYKNEGEIHDDWQWTPLSAFVVDKYSVHWMLCVSE